MLQMVSWKVQMVLWKVQMVPDMDTVLTGEGSMVSDFGDYPVEEDEAETGDSIESEMELDGNAIGSTSGEVELEVEWIHPVENRRFLEEINYLVNRYPDSLVELSAK